jgi:hypothetical protein
MDIMPPTIAVVSVITENVKINMNVHIISTN